MRAEILKLIALLFGRNDVFMKSFRFLLTFRTEKANLQLDSLDVVIPVLSYLTFLKCKVLNNLAVIWFFKSVKKYEWHLKSGFKAFVGLSKGKVLQVKKITFFPLMKCIHPLDRVKVKFRM